MKIISVDTELPGGLLGAREFFKLHTGQDIPQTAKQFETIVGNVIFQFRTLGNSGDPKVSIRSPSMDDSDTFGYEKISFRDETRIVTEFDSEFSTQVAFLSNLTNTHAEGVITNILGVTLDNLSHYLTALLKAFGEGKISVIKMSEFGDALSTYLLWRYIDEYPDTICPDLARTDPRSVAFNMVTYIEGRIEFVLLPEDVSFFIEMLQLAKKHPRMAHDELDRFVEQNGKLSRHENARRRGLFDEW